MPGSRRARHDHAGALSVEQPRTDARAGAEPRAASAALPLRKIARCEVQAVAGNTSRHSNEQARHPFPHREAVPDRPAGGRARQGDRQDALHQARHVTQMLIGKVLFAGRPHARIVRLDTPRRHAACTRCFHRQGCRRSEVSVSCATTSSRCARAARDLRVAAKPGRSPPRARSRIEYGNLPGVLSPEAGAGKMPADHEDFPGNQTCASSSSTAIAAAPETTSDFVVGSVFRPHHVTHALLHGTSCAMSLFRPQRQADDR